jgi:hypothetical protein
MHFQTMGSNYMDYNQNSFLVGMYIVPIGVGQ